MSQPSASAATSALCRLPSVDRALAVTDLERSCPLEAYDDSRSSPWRRCTASIATGVPSVLLPVIAESATLIFRGPGAESTITCVTDSKVSTWSSILISADGAMIGSVRVNNSPTLGSLSISFIGAAICESPVGRERLPAEEQRYNTGLP